jgi:hypothetical protein
MMRSRTWLAVAQGLHEARGRAGALVGRALSGPTLAAMFVALYALTYLRQFPLLKWHDVPQITFPSITGQRPAPAVGLVLAGMALVALCWRMWRLAAILPVRSALRLLVAG